MELEKKKGKPQKGKKDSYPQYDSFRSMYDQHIVNIVGLQALILFCLVSNTEATRRIFALVLIQGSVKIYFFK